MDSNLIVALVSSLFTAVVGPIAVHVAKDIIDKKNKKDNLKEALQKNTLVSTKIEEIREQTKADRVWVTQFHNGGTFYPTGKSIQKFSMFYESVEPGCESIKLLFQNIPVSLFAPSANKILIDNIAAIPDFKDETVATYGLKYTEIGRAHV